MISSVASVLTIRAFLAATGYPQIGSEGPHIAHALWGGSFVVSALLGSYSFMGIVVQRFSSNLAGVGFGTFIDELGKFITSDNDYFYQPTSGLIYISFIAIFVVLRIGRQYQRLTPPESLANASGHLVNASALAAVVGLFLNILCYMALHFILDREIGFATGADKSVDPNAGDFAPGVGTRLGLRKAGPIEE